MTSSFFSLRLRTRLMLHKHPRGYLPVKKQLFDHASGIITCLGLSQLTLLTSGLVVSPLRAPQTARLEVFVDSIRLFRRVALQGGY